MLPWLVVGCSLVGCLGPGEVTPDRETEPAAIPAGRPALGFELGVSTQRDVVRWTYGNGLRCRVWDKEVVCRGIAEACRLVASFDDRGQLVRVVAQRISSPAQTQDRFDRIRRRLHDEVGPATTVRQDPSQSEQRFEYPGYEAIVATTRVDALSHRLEERYALR